MKSVILLCYFTASVLWLPSVAHCATLAYWRFEEGPLGGKVPASGSGGAPAFDNTVLDSSGNGNHARTWNNNTSPTYVAPHSSVVPQTGATNNFALQFKRETTGNDDIYTSSKPINTTSLASGFTFEFSVRPEGTGWQTFFGKDGKPTSSVEPPMRFNFVDESQTDKRRVRFHFIDTGTNFRTLTTLAPLTLNEWYHFAATNDGSIARLYLKGPSDSNYVLQASSTTVGGMLLSSGTGSYSIGRGMWNGNVTDWSDATIDEVRISSVALSPDAFLMVPEPSSAVLVGIAGVATLLLRRRAKQKSAA